MEGKENSAVCGSVIVRQKIGGQVPVFAPAARNSRIGAGLIAAYDSRVLLAAGGEVCGGFYRVLVGSGHGPMVWEWACHMDCGPLHYLSHPFALSA